MNTTVGLTGVLGIWLTMAMMPLAELLAIAPLQATLLRGLPGVIAIGFVALFKKNLITSPDRPTLAIAFFFSIATLCLFQGIMTWGSNYSALFLDMAVMVPIYLAWRRKQEIDTTTRLAFIMAIIGTMIALRVLHGGEFILEGFLWSTAALISNGFFIEYAGKATQTKSNRVFWMSLGLVLVGIVSILDFKIDESLYISQTSWIILSILFAVTTGIINFYSGFMVFDNFKPIYAGIFILGVTPSIMLSSYLIIDRTMGADQLAGVTITLGATFLFGKFLNNKK